MFSPTFQMATWSVVTSKTMSPFLSHWRPDSGTANGTWIRYRSMYDKFKSSKDCFSAFSTDSYRFAEWLMIRQNNLIFLFSQSIKRKKEKTNNKWNRIKQPKNLKKNEETPTTYWQFGCDKQIATLQFAIIDPLLQNTTDRFLVQINGRTINMPTNLWIIHQWYT